MLSGLAVLAGPSLGDFIVTHFRWRWIFYLNIPVGIARLGSALVVIPDLRPGRRHRLDLLGVALVPLFLMMFVCLCTCVRKCVTDRPPMATSL
jgi:MFS family permease